MKVGVLILSFVMLSILSPSQQTSHGFKTIIVNKTLSEFPDSFDLSSPLKAFVTFNYTFINGRHHLLKGVCSAKYKSELADSTHDSNIPEEVKKLHLTAKINEIEIYKDSIAFVISKYEGGDYSIRAFYLELGKWVNAGEDRYKYIEVARQHIKNRIDLVYGDYQNVYANFLTSQ